jgi:hypothetical protein
MDDLKVSATESNPSFSKPLIGASLTSPKPSFPLFSAVRTPGGAVPRPVDHDGRGQPQDTHTRPVAHGRYPAHDARTGRRRGRDEEGGERRGGAGPMMM